jgi:hypothetical protein
MYTLYHGWTVGRVKLYDGRNIDYMGCVIDDALSTCTLLPAT